MVTNVLTYKFDLQDRISISFLYTERRVAANPQTKPIDLG